MLKGENVPPELAEGWEFYNLVKDGIVKPVTWREWLTMDANLARQVIMVSAVSNEVIEAKRQTHG